MSHVVGSTVDFDHERQEPASICAADDQPSLPGSVVVALGFRTIASPSR